MFNSSSFFQLSDFGFATWVSSSSLTPTQKPCIDVAGTFGYLLASKIYNNKGKEEQVCDD